MEGIILPNVPLYPPASVIKAVRGVADGYTVTGQAQNKPHECARWSVQTRAASAWEKEICSANGVEAFGHLSAKNNFIK